MRKFIRNIKQRYSEHKERKADKIIEEVVLSLPPQMKNYSYYDIFIFGQPAGTVIALSLLEARAKAEKIYPNASQMGIQKRKGYSK